jgi:hypothetical protein
MPSACAASRIAVAQDIIRCGPSNITRLSPDGWAGGVVFGVDVQATAQLRG